MYLGIEIGGTKLQLAVGPGDGRLLATWRRDIDARAGAQAIRDAILLALPELLASPSLRGVPVTAAGIGFGGPVDHARQRAITSHQVAGWDDFPLASWLTQATGLPTSLANDADAAALAEAQLGAGRGVSPVFYVTVGSGIGGGLVIEGEVHLGAGRGAAELGQLRFLQTPNPAAGLFGGVASVESVASGFGIAERAARAPRSEPIAQAAGAGPITARAVALAAERGDPLALAILAPAIDTLADALCHVVALLCPRRIVIGGGVAMMPQPLFMDPLRRRIEERAFPPFRGLFDVVPAALGEEVVLHGALALARRAAQR